MVRSSLGWALTASTPPLPSQHIPGLLLPTFARFPPASAPVPVPAAPPAAAASFVVSVKARFEPGEVLLLLVDMVLDEVGDEDDCDDGAGVLGAKKLVIERCGIVLAGSTNSRGGRTGRRRACSCSHNTTKLPWPPRANFKNKSRTWNRLDCTKRNRRYFGDSFSTNWSFFDLWCNLAYLFEIAARAFNFSIRYRNPVS